MSARPVDPPTASTSAREELRGPRRVCAVLTGSGCGTGPVHLIHAARSRPPRQVDLGRRPGVERGSSPRGGAEPLRRGTGIREDLAAAGHPAGGPPGGPHAPRAPAAARCGPAPGGRLHPRADPVQGSCCTAFVTGPGPVRDGRIDRPGHQQPHGAPTTRPAPPGRRSGRASTATAATLGGPAPPQRPRQPVPVHRPRRTTRRRGHRGIGRSRGILPARAPPPRPRANPCKRGARLARLPLVRTATTPGTATAQWVSRCNRTRPHRANPDDISPAAAEHRYHRNHTTAAPPATA